MFSTILDFFNQRTSGEQVLMLFVAAVFLLAISVQAGRLAYHLFGS